MSHPYFTTFRDSAALFEGEGVTLLMYHKVAAPPVAAHCSRALYVSRGLFDRQVAQLRAGGLHSVPLGEARHAAGTGARAFCITFDDGFKSVFENALPTLVAKGIRATQFLVAGLIGKTNRWERAREPLETLMDEGQIREWLAAGQDIGSHTITHPRLTRLDPRRARSQIVNSKKMLEDRFGEAVQHFCYPFGDLDDRVRDYVAEAGYATACTTSFGRLTLDSPDPYRLPRVMARYRSLGFISMAAVAAARAWRRFRLR